ncbi:MAG: KTSC domain-containing protein [Chthoniobacter sp.]|uniref:KTSC domain-containing protein n=1 Tax=Chthoniobacter sp. TaxID=2510640 RepID=UPI0032AE6954
MSRTAVNSSNVRSIGYDAWSATLEVEFHSRSVYQHYDVPADLYDRFMNAGSKGRFYYSNLRNRYGCRRVG